MRKTPWLIITLILVFLAIQSALPSLYAFEVEVTTVTPTDSAPLNTAQPSEFTAFDTPNNCLGDISLSWKGISPEDNATFYVVYIDKSADGKFEQVAAKFPATGRWKTNEHWPFWVSGTKDLYHYLKINILEQYPVSSMEELCKKQEELQVVRKDLEQAKKDKKDVSELKSKKLILMNEVNALKDKVDQEEKEAKLKEYYFKVVKTDKDNNILFTSPILKAQAKNNWFNFSLINNFIVMILFCGIVLWFISHAKKNKELFLRRINGLDAIEEAVGRATEMGRPIFYQTGISDLSDISTICATVILGKISEKIAQYDTQLKVPHRDPIVMSVCQEIVKEAYIKSGRPDAYKEDSNFYVTGDQFAYTAAVNGMMLREKPAANFFMGYYMAEALLLTECGSSTGAIQIAGTDATDQLPFFITTCDYTLIGEEYYAASAYLSRDPVLVGTLKAQDVGKGVMLVALIFFTIFALTHSSWLIDLIKDFS
ncbi:MAG: hypothetical protein HY811_08730 [Planctomycetes bacterium]|nr:hypothetical protein [Planctomycetota bacterium]